MIFAGRDWREVRRSISFDGDIGTHGYTMCFILMYVGPRAAQPTFPEFDDLLSPIQ